MIDCVCFIFVLTFFMIWTIGVRGKLSAMLNCGIGQMQKTKEGQLHQYEENRSNKCGNVTKRTGWEAKVCTS